MYLIWINSTIINNLHCFTILWPKPSHNILRTAYHRMISYKFLLCPMCLASLSTPAELHHTGTVEVSLRSGHILWYPPAHITVPEVSYHTAAGELWLLSVWVNYTQKYSESILKHLLPFALSHFFLRTFWEIAAVQKWNERFFRKCISNGLSSR